MADIVNLSQVRSEVERKKALADPASVFDHELQLEISFSDDKLSSVTKTSLKGEPSRNGWSIAAKAVSETGWSMMDGIIDSPMESGENEKELADAIPRVIIHLHDEKILTHLVGHSRQSDREFCNRTRLLVMDQLSVFYNHLKANPDYFFKEESA